MSGYTNFLQKDNIFPRAMNAHFVRSTKKSEVKVWRHSKCLWRTARDELR